ncbi:sodium:solute symporter [Siminovitchia fortis]|uniref:Sodium:solute symporter n=1 Tax=Siminovitchia fortis TaxID=254758 RepID=A0A443IMP6_9BACI|nr:sodium:solute symporter [Siminovitchia fortis]RWR06944.1 sodium:solute symporter [Siminovitchia fortis]WHY82104.1 sodium:solute symporter [Siminovitchia fortis]
MGTIDIVIIILYFALIAGVGVYGARRATNSEEYMVAGRNLNFFMYLGCLAAVILGGASTMGTAKLGYEFGLSGIWMVVAIGAGVVCLGIFLTKKISRFKVLTISEMLEKRYNKETRLVSAIVAAIYTLMLTVVQMIGIGSLLNVWLGWNLPLCIILGGGIVFLYTTLGGMWSVTMTDIVQFVIMTVGVFFLMLPLSLSKAGGWGTLNAELPAEFFNLGHIGGDRIFQYFILFTLGLMVGQDIWQRLFTARTPKVSKYGTMAAGMYAMVYAIALAVIGMCAFILIPNIADTQNVFAEMAMVALPPGILGIVLASVASAVMSTASGTIIACSTLISNDVVKRFFKPDIGDKQFMLVSRLTTVGIGIFSIICAIWIQDILVALDVAYAVLSGALFFPVIFGLFTKKVNARAAFYSIILSAAVILAGLGILGITATEPIVYGLAVSLVSIVLLSFFPSKKEKNEADIKVG